MMLALVLLAGLLPGTKAQVDCGRSCLLPCRQLAISCVTGGVSPSEFTKLMQCVIANAQSEEYKKKNPTHNQAVCWACIEPQLQKLSLKEKEICLQNNQVDTCAELDKKDCNNLFFTQDCGFIGGKCMKMKKSSMTHEKYKEVIALFKDKDECKKIGGKWRDEACKAHDEHKVKCGKVNKSHRKDCRECEDLCWWLPKCEYKHKRDRCAGGPTPFKD